MQSPVQGKRKEKSKKSQPQETVLLRYPEPKYKFQGKKVPKNQGDNTVTTPLQNVSNPASSPRSHSSNQIASQTASLQPVTGVTPVRPGHESQSQTFPTSSNTGATSPQTRTANASPKVTQVSPMTPGQNVLDASKTSPLKAAGLPVSSSAPTPATPTSQPLQNRTVAKTSKPISIVDPLHPRGSSKNGQEQGMPSSSSEDLQEQLQKMQAERDSARGQLEVQLQVNAELKKLLVASMGEELETRVEKLARDKAEMSQELGGFSRRMTEDYENMDKLSIQADMWRSKYLASKVMVDELASSRAFLTMQFQESQEALQQMLNERHELRANLMEAYKCLQQVKEAFDPLNSQQSPTSLPSGNALSLAKTTQQLAETIRFRLLPSHVSLHTAVTIEDSWQASMTQAEAHANELLSRKVDLESVNFASLPLSRSGKIERYHPQVNFDNLTLNCCAHCKGEISLL